MLGCDEEFWGRHFPHLIVLAWDPMPWLGTVGPEGCGTLAYATIFIVEETIVQIMIVLGMGICPFFLSKGPTQGSKRDKVSVGFFGSSVGTGFL